MDDYSVEAPDSGNPEVDKVNLNGGVPSDGNGIQELGGVMKVLTRVDLDLAYSNEKLVNLQILSTHALAWTNDIEVMDINSYYSEDSLEKALVYGFLSGFLETEVKELGDLMNTLQGEIVRARQEMCSFRHLKEMFSLMEEKLQDTEKSWKQSQEQVLEMNMLAAKMQRANLPCVHMNGRKDQDINILENGQVPNINAKLNLETVEQQRDILKLVDRSLARELYFEKMSLEFKENEKELKLKLHQAEKVAFHMEEEADFSWGRLLEAENAAEVLMGISKDLLNRLQVVQFNLNCSMQRESAMRSDLQDCLEKLKVTETAFLKLDSGNTKPHLLDSPQTMSTQFYLGVAEEKYCADGSDSEVLSLREKVKFLEERLKESEDLLKNVNASNEPIEEKFNLMENVIESLKEGISEAGSRAETAEAKVTELTETNLELNEELNFLKGGNPTERVSILEKKVRELEIQLQNSKASSEASQEQMNMLYSAIWDMETLIEELKSKVSKAEIKTETAEEQCVMLSETNHELEKELNFVRARMECLEASLHQANDEKAASAEDVAIKSKLMMDMVLKLAIERERIQKELHALTKENKILAQKSWICKKEASVVCNNGDGNEKEHLFRKHDSVNAFVAKISGPVMESSSGGLQADG